MPKTYTKHYYKAWSEDRAKLGGFAKLIVDPGEAYSHCERCKVFVVMKKSGGLKFWVGGKLVAKRPPCEA